MDWEFINNYKTEKQLEKEAEKEQEKSKAKTQVEVVENTTEITTTPKENIRVTKVELKVIDTKTGIIYKDMWQASMKTGVKAFRIATQCKDFKGKGRFQWAPGTEYYEPIFKWSL